MIADIDDHADAAIADLKATGEATFIHCDVGERLDVRNLVASTLETYGDINILVNNAGILHQAEFLDLKEDDFDAVLRVNLKGPFLCGQQVARHMVEQVEAGAEPGSIINISSVNAVLAITDQVPYSISKAGLRQLTNVMALALAPHGIRVNAIGPGTVLDDTAEDIHDAPDFRRVQLSRTPMGRMGETPRNRGHRRIFGIGRGELPDRPDDLRRWRADGAELHGAGGGGVGGG